jgi:hypothetical protein
VVATLALAAAILLLAVRLTCLDYLERKGGKRLPGFNAATVVEALDWTFEPHVPGAKGVIPEPNDQQIADFLTGIKALTEGLQTEMPEAIDPANTAEMMLALDDLDPQLVVRIHDQMAGIYAALCSGQPSKELILRLPTRIRILFYGWLQQEVMSPEAAPGGGNAQVATLRSAAAG